MNERTQTTEPTKVAEAPPAGPTEKELLIAILAELKALNELAKIGGVCVRDKFR